MFEIGRSMASKVVETCVRRHDDDFLRLYLSC